MFDEGKATEPTTKRTDPAGQFPPQQNPINRNPSPTSPNCIIDLEHSPTLIQSQGDEGLRVRNPTSNTVQTLDSQESFQDTSLLLPDREQGQNRLNKSTLAFREGIVARKLAVSHPTQRSIDGEAISLVSIEEGMSGGSYFGSPSDDHSSAREGVRRHDTQKTILHLDGRASWWRRSAPAARTVAMNDNLDSNLRKRASRLFPPNVVRNQKYSLISFIPQVLYNQFFEALRVNYLFTNAVPLAVVIAVTMLKEAHDDYQRYIRDKEANSQNYVRVTTQGLQEIPSSEICIGDVILVRKDQRIPADMIFLRSSDKSGSTFIRTDQLDGEIDWKMRVAVSSCQKLTSDYEVFNMDAIIYADKPHKDIYSFLGNFNHSNADGSEITEPLNLEHTLWMNTVLATGTALGCVIYTGKETRACMNTSQPKTKFGITDLEINHMTKILAVFTLIMSISMLSMKGWTGTWWIYLIRYIVLFSSIIPISMRVNLDLGKTVYATEIMNDEKIPGAIVRTGTLPEELGRVQYLLTDKTGTLTKNDMELKKLHLGTLSYGSDTCFELQSHLHSALLSMTEINPETGQTRRKRGSMAHVRNRRDVAGRAFETMLALALCHNVTPVFEGKTLTYQASSPDEVAIVRWCERIGMTLVYRDRESIHIKFGEILIIFDILHVFPFTSETKRMGIIVRDTETGEIFFLEKGADSTMSKIVVTNDWLDEECANMAREGLRTLVVGKKRLMPETLESFELAYHQARTSLQDRNNQMQSCIETILEHDLELLCLTGVEDKLQDDVRATLEKLRHAGVRIWMLTGDKVETATNIAISTRLFARDRRILQYQRLTTEQECRQLIATIERTRNCCLVIDGPSLHLIMSLMPADFMTISLQLDAVVCCRCTPTQKADVARMIQQYSSKRVCCIGDGGNDVSMIQAADVGIGIVGKEGKQASLAADFSINQFSHILRLLVWHGRNSYMRTSKLAMFVIHRGMVISAMQAVFSSIFFFLPVALFQGLIAVGYVTVYTMAPVFSLVLDRDVSEEVALTYVELYRDLVRGRELTMKVFFKTLLIAIYQGGAIMLMAIVLFERDLIHLISITFTALILNELLMIAMEICTWHYVMGIAEIASFLIYVASVRILKGYFDTTFTTSFTFFWKVALITLVSFFPLYFITAIKHILSPASTTKLQQS